MSNIKTETEKCNFIKKILSLYNNWFFQFIDEENYFFVIQKNIFIDKTKIKMFLS